MWWWDYKLQNKTEPEPSPSEKYTNEVFEKDLKFHGSARNLWKTRTHKEWQSVLSWFQLITIQMKMMDDMNDKADEMREILKNVTK